VRYISERSKIKRGKMKVEREETWDITNSCKSLKSLEKGALIVERRNINHADLQNTNYKQIIP
jgi:hypothetical protein